MKLSAFALLGIVMAAAPIAVQAVPYSDDDFSREINVNNNSDYQVYHIYYGVPGGTYYGRDLLADEVINPNDSRRVLVDNASGRCRFWVQATTKSGKAVWERYLNVCTETDLNLGN